MDLSCPHRLLIIEDDRAVARALQRVFASAGYRVAISGSVTHAVSQSGEFEAAVFDLHLPDGNGLDAARALVAAGRVGGIVFYTATNDQQELAAASNFGLVVRKTEPITALIRAVNRVARHTPPPASSRRGAGSQAETAAESEPPSRAPRRRRAR